jgi:hypothetical protein
MTVYNPGNMKKLTPLRIKVPKIKFDLIDQNNKLQETDIICANNTD